MARCGTRRDGGRVQLDATAASTPPSPGFASSPPPASLEERRSTAPLSSKSAVRLSTARLRLRPLALDDLAAITAINADPQVNAWLGGESLASHSGAALKTMRERLAANGWGILAVCDFDGDLLGLAGLQPVRPTLPAAPAVEAVWRLKRAAWGRGYVVEAMQAILAALPADAGLNEILALVAKPNLRSARTAETLDFRYDPAADFLHPTLDAGHPLRLHGVYRKRILT